MASSLFAMHAHAQTVNECLQHSAQLLLKKNYPAAIELAHRANFFAENPAQKSLCNYYLGMSHFYMLKPEAAESFLLNALDNHLSDSLSTITLQAIAICCLWQNQPLEALRYLQKLPDSLQKVVWPYICLAYTQNKQLDSAYHYAAANMGASAAKRMIKTYKKATKINPSKAAVLSSLLPGSGLVYAHQPLNGLHSFILISALTGLAVWAAVVYTPFDAVLWVGPWWLKYYVGGAQRARIAAETYRHKAILKILEMQSAKNP